jgi:transposase
LTVEVSAANVKEHTVLEDMLDGVTGRSADRAAPPAAGQTAPDMGYDYRSCCKMLTRRRIKARIARKGIESSTRLGRHRNVIERCLEWMTRFRGLARRHERKASHYTGFLQLACTLICYRLALGLNLLTSQGESLLPQSDQVAVPRRSLDRATEPKPDVKRGA